jgi:hypothetical protein
MRIEGYKNWIQTEAEELSEALMGVAYFDLCPELQTWIWTRAYEFFWTEGTQQDSVEAP